MESYRGLWLKGAIIMALNMHNAGLAPVEVGLGERDFYIDVQSDSSLSLQESEKFAQWKDYKYEIKDGKIIYNGKQISFQGDVIPSGEPRYFKVLNISVHHPSANTQLVRIRV